MLHKTAHSYRYKYRYRYRRRYKHRYRYTAHTTQKHHQREQQKQQASNKQPTNNSNSNNNNSDNNNENVIKCFSLAPWIVLSPASIPLSPSHFTSHQQPAHSCTQHERQFRVWVRVSCLVRLASSFISLNVCVCVCVFVCMCSFIRTPDCLPFRFNALHEAYIFLCVCGWVCVCVSDAAAAAVLHIWHRISRYIYTWTPTCTHICNNGCVCVCLCVKLLYICWEKSIKI